MRLNRLLSYVFFFLCFTSSLAQSPQEWQRHRSEFMRHLSTKSIAVFKASKEVTRNGDVEYAYRQDSDFYYLTGLTEKESMLLLAPRGLKLPGQAQPAKEILFVMSRNPMSEVWDGVRLGVEGAQAQLGFSAVLTNDQFDQI